MFFMQCVPHPSTITLPLSPLICAPVTPLSFNTYFIQYWPFILPSGFDTRSSPFNDTHYFYFFFSYLLTSSNSSLLNPCLFLYWGKRKKKRIPSNGCLLVPHPGLRLIPGATCMALRLSSCPWSQQGFGWLPLVGWHEETPVWADAGTIKRNLFLYI